MSLCFSGWDRVGREQRADLSPSGELFSGVKEGEYSNMGKQFPEILLVINRAKN